MYKVLLVDDEALIREAISENTKWNELGYELVGACRNGKEAMEMIKQSPPDLLLTDICMPHVDGMELTKFVYEEYRETKVVVISGYDDFEYAKKAVKYQVVDYILKPITAMELSETLLKVKGTLDEERSKSRNMKKIRGAYISNLPLLRGRFLNGLLQGSVSTELLKEKLEDYHIMLKGNSFMAATIVGDDVSGFLRESQENKRDLAYFAIYNIAEEIMNDHKCGVAVQDMEERTILIFSSEENVEKEALHICTEIQAAILKFLKIQCTIGLGRKVIGIEWIYQSFTEAKKAVEYKFLLGSNQVICAEKLGENQEKPVIAVEKWVEQTLLAIKTDNKEEISVQVEAFMQAIRDAYVTKNRSIFYIQSFILSVMSGLDSAGISENPIFNKEKELLSGIYGKEHLSEIGKDVIEFCEELLANMLDQRDGLCKKQAIMALDYIEKNYGDSGISLNSVCGYLSMSTSYFSTIFKNHTGETFIEALTKKRIEKAKWLMANTAKRTYEIADEVGYGDPHYFSVTFKKITGFTPTEYTKRVR